MKHEAFTIDDRMVGDLSCVWVFEQMAHRKCTVVSSLSVPKTAQVYQALRKLLDSATLQPGDRLPAMRSMAQEHDANIHAVYSAIRQLEHEGLVVSEHGRGVFVTKSSPALRNILLLNRTQGHMWADLTQHFVERFSKEPQYRLMVDMVPSPESGMLPMFREKLQSLPASGIETVIFNGLAENHIRLVLDDIPTSVQKMCIFSRNSIGRSNISGVSSDWYHGGYIAGRHLLDIGCKNIVVITPTLVNQQGGIVIGATAAMEENPGDARIDPFYCKGFVEDIHANFDALLKQFPKVDGIFTHGDFLAVPLIKHLQALGRRVPDDIAVVGYYNTPWVDLSEPALTSVDPCNMVISDQAIDMALAGDFISQRIVHPKLVIRGSTRR